MRRDGHEALERLMTFHIMQHREACDDAFEALQLVAMCMAKLLELRLLPGSVINAQDFDTDLSPLLAALMRSFDASKPLHRSMEYHAVPLDRVAKYPQLAALQQAGRLRGWGAAQPDTTLQDADMGAAAAIEPFYSKACYAQYVNTFGGLNGFTYMLQVRTRVWRSCSQLSGGGARGCMVGRLGGSVCLLWTGNQLSARRSHCNQT
jgi:hypothetical protein